jgi:hypothetical protein
MTNYNSNNDIKEYVQNQNYSIQNNTLKNLSEKMKDAELNNDLEKIKIINKIYNEIEKLLLVREIQKIDKMHKFYIKDVNNVIKDGSFHLIEMILQKEIELLDSGDYQAIEVLNKIKKNTQDKIQKLNLIILQNQKSEQSSPNIPVVRVIVEKPSSYKPMIAYEGFHFEKTLGGEFIEVLDPDIKILVGSDIVNSKPQDLSMKIIDDIKNIKRGNELSEDSSILIKKTPSIKDKINSNENSHDYIKGKWTNKIVSNVLEDVNMLEKK